MTGYVSPRLEAAAASTRTEAQVRARRSASQDHRTKGEDPPPVPASREALAALLIRCADHLDASEHYSSIRLAREIRNTLYSE